MPKKSKHKEISNKHIPNKMTDSQSRRNKRHIHVSIWYRNSTVIIILTVHPAHIIPALGCKMKENLSSTEWLKKAGS